MVTINLRKFFSWYTADESIEVSEALPGISQLHHVAVGVVEVIAIAASHQVVGTKGTALNCPHLSVFLQ